MKKTFALGVMMIGAAIAGAQSPGEPERPPILSGPLLSRMPEVASWKIVTLGVAAGGAKAPGDIKCSLVIKNGTTFHSEIVLENGMELEGWWVNGVQVLRRKGDSVLVVARQTGEPYYMNYKDTDFPDIGWVAPDCYSGLQRVNGRQCLVFKKEGCIAWIDPETHLPVQVLENGIVKSYTFLQRPDAAIVVPPNVEKEISAVLALKARTDRHAPRP